MALYRTLSEPELDRVAAGAALAGQLVGKEELPRVTDLQVLYDILLQNADGAELAIEALGYAFGTVLLQHDWLHWAMMLDEEFGDEVAIVVQDRELGCSPLSMIRNRLEDGEPCDLAELADSTVARLRQLGQRAASS